MNIAPHIRRKTASFATDVRAAAAVEFALVAAPLIALILASLQIAIIFFFDQTLQTASQSAARQLMTGVAQNASYTPAQFKAAVCANAPSPFQCGNVMVDVQSGNSFSNIDTAPITLTYDSHGVVSNTWSYSPGNPGDIVIVRVMYNWPVIGGPLALNLANQPNGNRLLMATVVFKNEPYS
jgi:Flp pilus assembly protein TadG